MADFQFPLEMFKSSRPQHVLPIQRAIETDIDL